MEVKILERKFKVYWMYNSRTIPYMAKDVGVGKEVVETLASLPMKRQIKEFKKLCPTVITPVDIRPDTTWCFIVEGEKIISISSVSRHYKDTDDRDKARKYSLAKALTVFTEREERKAFWVAYLNRGVRTPAPMVVV